MFLSLQQCEIDDDGCLYLPADASAIQHALHNMDLDEARLQTQRSGLQAQQVRYAVCCRLQHDVKMCLCVLKKFAFTVKTV